MDGPIVNLKVLDEVQNEQIRFAHLTCLMFFMILQLEENIFLKKLKQQFFYFIFILQGI